MSTDSLRLHAVLPAPPSAIWDAWMDGDLHTAMTGAEATCDARPGGAFTAWDGYISGVNLELAPGARFVQSWRSSEFPDDAPDSRLEVTLTVAEGGTAVVIDHSNIPAGQGASYERGWEEFYFTPMRAYFSKG